MTGKVAAGGLRLGRRLALARHDVRAVVFAAVLPPGPFAFRLAGVRLE